MNSKRIEYIYMFNRFHLHDKFSELIYSKKGKLFWAYHEWNTLYMLVFFRSSLDYVRVGMLLCNRILDSR